MKPSWLLFWIIPLLISCSVLTRILRRKCDVGHVFMAVFSTLLGTLPSIWGFYGFANMDNLVARDPADLAFEGMGFILAAAATLVWLLWFLVERRWQNRTIWVAAVAVLWNLAVWSAIVAAI